MPEDTRKGCKDAAVFSPSLQFAQGNITKPKQTGALFHPFRGLARRVGRRLILSSVPAAGVTGGLFLIMAALIAVDFTPAKAEVTRLIERITPTPIEEFEVTRRSKPKPIETTAQPSPPPRLTIIKSVIDVARLEFTPFAPTVNRGSIDIPRPAIAAFDDDILPIRPPLVTYPPIALNRGLEGTCNVTMDVSAKGRPYNVVASCSDSVFEREAVRAVSRVEFRPRVVENVAVERRNVVYPLKFNLQ